MSDSEYSESLDVNGQDESEGNDIHMQLIQQQQLQQQQYYGQQQHQPQNVSYMSYAGSTSSSAESSISSTSSDESDENDSEDTLELAKLNKELLSLPRGLCENAAIFQEFFSLETWQELPVSVQNHLQQFLPKFDKILPPQMAAVEQTRTISMLFNNELNRFGQTPLTTLQQQLEVGNYRPDILKLRKTILKSRRREEKFQHCERLSHMAKQLFLSRQRLLDAAYKSSPDTILKQPFNSHNTPQPKPSHLFTDNKLSAIRARKRFYSEISQIAEQLGLKDDTILSADEDEEDSILAEEIKKDNQFQQRSSEEASEAVKTSNSLADRCIYSTVFKKLHHIEDEEACRLQHKAKHSKLNNRSFKEYLREHKRRKITEPTLPEFETSDIRLRDVCARAQMGGNFKRMFAFGKTPGRKPKIPATSSTTTTATSSTTTPTNMPAVTTSTTLPSLTTTSSNISTPKTITNNVKPISITTTPPTTAPATFTQTLMLTKLPPPKLSEPPALVPIQPQPKKPETYQIVNTAKKSPQKDFQQHLQPSKQHSMVSNPPHLEIQNKINSSNNSNDTINLSQLMSVGNHADNLNLCIDDSSLLTDHDAFSMLDSEVELQQEEVETFGSTCEETIPAFVIGNDVVMPSASNDATNETKTNVLNTNTTQQRQQMDNIITQPVPKLEPISRFPQKSSIATSTSQSAVSELIQETHASYFSLIRDFFCSTPNHRMRYDDLRHKIDVWLRNPITALNEWYSLAENWSNLLKSAINFLVGEFPDLPEEYVPYIEHKVQLNIYQWIGAGRDSDTRLTELCNLWMEKRKQPADKLNASTNSTTNTREQTELKLDIYARSSVENEDSRDAGGENNGGLTPPPPPPRCPTNWTVRAATSEEIKEFQRQERERFEQPHKAYTYRMHGYESVVGPVKGIYTPLLALSKARGHSMMVGDRPNFVTILTLVRDATARLPNGEGTRAEISELLKCSQYINRDASENVLQTIVSGALDRMHTEHDPCVRYDPKRKIWIYLHRNRTEKEFERIHQQNQNLGKTKKLPQRKPKPLVNSSTGNSNKTADNDSYQTVGGLENTNVNAAVTGSLLTMPALVPSNPIIVTNANSVLQRQQQVLQQQQLLNANKCPPVPPLKYNIPPTQANSSQQQQQKSLLKTNIRTENKSLNTANNNNSSNLNKQHSFQMPQNKTTNTTPNQNTTPIIVATPQGLQTVHVSNATSVMSNQQNQQQMTQQSSSTVTANLAGKRVTLNKPIIINQVNANNSSNNTTITANQTKLKSPQPQLVQKSQLIQNRLTLQNNQQQSNLLIPISMANNLNLQSSSEQTINSNPAATTTNNNNTSSSSNQIVNNQSQISQATKQNIIRLVPAANVKTLMNATNSGNTTQVVNRQRIVSTNSSTERPTTPQQKTITSGGIQLLSSSGNVLTVAAGSTTNQAGSIVKMSPQQFATLQQKQQGQQQQQHIIVKQGGIVKATGGVTTGNKPQRVILGNTAIVSQTGQTKNIVLQQIPVASSSVVVTTTQTTTTSSAPTTISGNKIQTINAKNLTPQQQRVLIQNLKQQQQQQQQTINQNQIQFKTVQLVSNNSSANNNTGRVQTVTMATTQQQNTGKPAIVMVSQDNGTTQLQQQNVTRILKTTSPQIKTEVNNAGTGTTTATRVITSSSGQIISLDSLIQKQGGTLRITGTGNNTQTIKTNQLQQQKLNSNVQQQQQVKQPQQQQQTQQFAIVSVPNSIISLGSNTNFSVGQRIITTQAGISSTNTTSLVNLNTTKVTPSIVSTGSGRVITATAAGTKIIKQSPTVSSATGSIRVINTVNQTTSNINLASLQGKQVVLASGKTLNTISKAQLQASQQQQQQQNVVQTAQGSIVIGGQTVKLQQGNTNIKQLLQKSSNIITSQNSTTTSSPQLQTVIMGNQILRVQQLPQIVNTGNRISVSNTATTTNTQTPKTIFVGSTGQTLRLQPSSTAGQTQTITNKNIIVQTPQQNPTNQTHTSGANTATTTSTPNRVVLAVQGGGQIFLSPNFQGGNINLKSLQNMKVVSLAQHPSAKLKEATANTTSNSTSSLAASTTAQQQQTILKTTKTASDTNV